ncbi:unnamed protein product [Spirodela intermedia]|uniref:Uncharacterized protein n=1 Tax=Spirodela intermedia TaxID=51605 RepID=A0ABN7EBE1_SPIIN|nr:unnamed protein product [Spirodela intermedia]
MASRPFLISFTFSSAKASGSSARPSGSKLPPGYSGSVISPSDGLGLGGGLPHGDPPLTEDLGGGGGELDRLPGERSCLIDLVGGMLPATISDALAQWAGVALGGIVAPHARILLSTWQTGSLGGYYISSCMI